MKNKYQKTSHHRSKYLAVSFFVIIIAVFGAMIAFKYLQPSNTPAQSAPTAPQAIKKSPKTTEKVIKPESSNDPDEDPFGKKPVQNDGANPNKSDHYTGVVNYANVANGKLLVRVTINQFIQGAGTCALTLSSGGRTYQATVPTANSASYATCQGFDIPVSELGSGHWEISIKVTANNKSGVITGKADI